MTESTYSSCECNTLNSKFDHSTGRIWENQQNYRISKRKSLWEIILAKAETREQRKASFSDIPFHRNSKEYLKEQIFPLLLPVMKDMLHEIQQSNVLWTPKYRFNGLDFLAENLWNRNPRFPERAKHWLHVFDIPAFKLLLDSKPRLRKPWLCSEEQAAIFIQKNVRGWLVRKRDDVQEMRQFWKVISEERNE